jgi:hypothetical protein
MTVATLAAALPLLLFTGCSEETALPSSVGSLNVELAMRPATPIPAAGEDPCVVPAFDWARASFQLFQVTLTYTDPVAAAKVLSKFAKDAPTSEAKQPPSSEASDDLPSLVGAIEG